VEPQGVDTTPPIGPEAATTPSPAQTADENEAINDDESVPGDMTTIERRRHGVNRRNPTLYEQFQAAEAAGRAAAETGDNSHRTRQHHAFWSMGSMMGMVNSVLHENVPPVDAAAEQRLLSALAPHVDDISQHYALVTAQMSAKRGLKVFGDKGVEALLKELKQLLDRKVMHGVDGRRLTRAEKNAALQYLMFLKEKRCGKIKGRGCADGRKQRVYKTKEETSSPTVTLESLFLTAVIDAKEGRDVATVDIPGAFMQADIDEKLHVRFDGEILDILLKLDPSYARFVTYQRGKKTLFTQLDKALYGTLQAALLFWKRLSSFLVDELGFKINKYDTCVANKIINGKQCTIIWYVDDLKISHLDPAVVTSIIDSLNKEFGKEAPLTVKRGKKHEYLGIDMDFTTPGKVVFTMIPFIEQIIEETPAVIMKGACVTPAANHLNRIDPKAKKLSKQDADLFHHIVAKLLYLAKRVRPDLQTAVAFLCTRVQAPDVDDFRKLGRCVRYLALTKDTCPLTLEADDSHGIKWWVDASYAVHNDMRSHTGATMTLGKGSVISMSTKQKINTRSSTEAELVGVNDAIGMILWTRNFLIAQGYKVQDNVVFQDNQSAMLLANNGRMSSSKKTKHIQVRYFFITDNIRRKQARVEYCPTDDMVGDYFTKPRQGSGFVRFRSTILNLPPSISPFPKECVETSTEQAVDCRSMSGTRGDTTVLKKSTLKKERTETERKLIRFGKPK